MKEDPLPSRSPLQPLLEDLLPPEADGCGPARAEVLVMAREAQTRRHRRRVQLASASGVLGACALAWLAMTLGPDSGRTVSLPAPGRDGVSAPAAPPRLVIRQVNDEELLSLLQGTPIALVERPNGKRALLVISQ